MKNIKSLIAALFIVISFSGCKKEKHKVEDAICNRIYYTTSLVVGGIDSTSAFVTNQYYSNIEFAYGTTGDKLIKAWKCECNNNTGVVGTIGVWAPNEEKNTLWLSFYGGPTNAVGPFWKGEDIEWNIKNVSSKELWLEVMYKGQLCELHLTSI